ncbi:MAG: hypothetical protein WCG14_02290 [Chlamydiia bacterium]
MNLLNSIPHIRRVASILLAASVKKTFPEACLLGGGSTPLGFYYDFAFPFSFQAPFLVLIEEGVTGLIKESSPIKELEMVPFSASEMLTFHKEPFRAEDVAGLDSSLVVIIQIGQFLDCLEEGLGVSSTSEAGAVKLKCFERTGVRDGRDIIRIWGAASSDKQSLKKFLKEEVDLVKRLHPQLGLDLDLFSSLLGRSGVWLWRPKGEALFNDLSLFLREALVQVRFSFVKLPSPCALEDSEDLESMPLTSDLLAKRASFLAEAAYCRVSEQVSFYDHHLQDFSCGLLKTRESCFDIQYIFCSEMQLLEESISSLLFISEMLKILCFEFKLVLSVRRVKPSALTKGEKICADSVRKAAHSVMKDSIVETTHSTFKGVKVEFRVFDALGRGWSTGFLQAFCSEEKSSQVTLLFSSLGSRERMIALMLEKHKGVPSLFLRKGT